MNQTYYAEISFNPLLYISYDSRSLSDTIPAMLTALSVQS